MKRRAFIAGCIASTVAARARAADRQRPARIGLIALPARANNPILDGLRQGLAEEGYVEGGNVVLEQRYAGGDAALLPGLIDELLALPVDVLVAQGTPASLAAKRQTTSVPIVILSGDPVGAGLVSSLARPGGNLTGTSILSGDYSVKWLQLLKEAVPRLQRVAVLWNPDNTVIAAERRLPTIGGFSHYPSLGGLMCYSVDFIAVGRKSASYVDRILKGARPADLPVEQATDFTLRINLKTAKALGLEIPPNLLARADEVIE